eukprot:GILI01017708.1.p1 GENE.GILI01017708.1~~GILI01017708.1.p1  ORF type:complete len:198 (-),score=37.02 GILI01017708.1:79-672(-)
MDFLHKIQAIVILDSEGNRVFAKYFPVAMDANKRVDTGLAAGIQWATPEKQKALEASMHAKSRGTADRNNFGPYAADGDVMVIENHAVVFDAQPELSFFIVGDANENILILSGVLSCLLESLQELLKSHGTIERRTLLENYDILVLVVDEMIDDGIIFEIAASAVVSEIAPFITDTTSTDNAKKVMGAFGRYIKQNL